MGWVDDIEKKAQESIGSILKPLTDKKAELDEHPPDLGPALKEAIDKAIHGNDGTKK